LRALAIGEVDEIGLPFRQLHLECGWLNSPHGARWYSPLA
jgi:hypothetical protein